LLKICSSEGLFTAIRMFAHVLHNYCKTTHSAGTNHSLGLVIFNDLFWSWCQISEVTKSLAYQILLSKSSGKDPLLHQTGILQLSH